MKDPHMESKTLQRFANDLNVDVEQIRSYRELCYFEENALEIQVQGKQAYLDGLYGTLSRLRPSKASALRRLAESVLPGIYENLNHITPEISQYLRKSFPDSQAYLFAQPGTSQLFPEIVAEAMQVAASDLIMLQDMKGHGFSPEAIVRLEAQLVKDAIAAATRLKRNAYETCIPYFSKRVKLR